MKLNKNDRYSLISSGVTMLCGVISIICKLSAPEVVSSMFIFPIFLIGVGVGFAIVTFVRAYKRTKYEKQLREYYEQLKTACEGCSYRDRCRLARLTGNKFK